MSVQLFQNNVDADLPSAKIIRNQSIGTATEDSTGALNFVVTAQFS